MQTLIADLTSVVQGPNGSLQLNPGALGTPKYKDEKKERHLNFKCKHLMIIHWNGPTHNRFPGLNNFDLGMRFTKEGVYRPFPTLCRSQCALDMCNSSSP